eukprot:9020086-Pyramimonas_sp.AAC.1
MGTALSDYRGCLRSAPIPPGTLGCSPPSVRLPWRLQPSVRPMGCMGDGRCLGSPLRRLNRGRAAVARRAIPFRRLHRPRCPFPVAARRPPRGCRLCGSTRS